MTMETTQHAYAPVNGLAMYYEIGGDGPAAVYIPPAWSHATVIPALPANRRWISVDLQGHGRTADIDRPFSFEQSAEDVVALLKHLGIEQADLFGESFGGIVALLIAIRHPEVVRRVAVYGSPWRFEDAYSTDMLEQFLAITDDSDSVQFQRENYKKVAPDPTHWPTLFEKVHKVAWNGFTPEELKSIGAPVLIALGDHDWLRPEHMVDMYRLIPNAELAVIPDAGHFVLYEDPDRLLPIVARFFDAPVSSLPFATPGTGYHPGVTR